MLLDVMMPGMSGLEVLSTIRRTLLRAELPVIMATALDAAEDLVRALDLGANDYVTKPLDMYHRPVILLELEVEAKRRLDHPVELRGMTHMAATFRVVW